MPRFKKPEEYDRLRREGKIVEAGDPEPEDFDDDPEDSPDPEPDDFPGDREPEPEQAPEEGPEVAPEEGSEAGREQLPETGPEKKPKAKTGSRRKSAKKGGRKVPDEKQRKHFVIRGVRKAPSHAVLPNGRMLGCRGQSAAFDGYYDLEELQSIAENWAHEHFGGTRVMVTVHDTGNNNKIIRTWNLTFDGLPNIDGIIADLYDGNIEGAIGGTPPTATPAQPATSADLSEADRLKKEAARIEAERQLRRARGQLEEEEIQELQRRADVRRAKREMEKQQRKEREREELEERFGPGAAMVPPGFRGRPGHWGSPPDIEDLPDGRQPVTKDEFFQMKRQDGLQAQIAEMKQFVQQQMQSKSEVSKMLPALATALSPVLTAMIVGMQEAAKDRRDSNQKFMQMIMESNKASSAQIDTVIKLTAASEERNKTSLTQMMELIRLGGELGAKDTSIVGEVGQAVSDVAQGVTSVIMEARNKVRRPSSPPARSPAPVPGRPSIPAGQLPSPAVPTPGTPSASGPTPARAGRPAEEIKTVTVEEHLRGVVPEIAQAIIEECEIRPTAAHWVEIAEDFLPPAAWKKIAGFKDMNALITFFQPFVPQSMGVMIYAKAQASVEIQDWLQEGFESLREIAIAKARPSRAASAPSPAPSPGTVAAGSKSSGEQEIVSAAPPDDDTEPVREEGVPDETGD